LHPFSLSSLGESLGNLIIISFYEKARDIKRRSEYFATSVKHPQIKNSGEKQGE
jgi:hypothetical protein